MELLDITDIQRGCVNDGPGMRTTVFLKGCIFHCPWCCNPETISFEPQFFIDERKCKLYRNNSFEMCQNCERNGGIFSVDQCLFGVKQPVSQKYTPEILCNELLRDKSLFDATNGGVTFSGGEPLLHSLILSKICEMLHEKGVSIFVETTLFLPEAKIKEILPCIDGFYIDLKLQPELKMLRNKIYLSFLVKNLSLIRKACKHLCFRLVFVDSVYEERDYIANMLNSWNVHFVELLKCHNLAEGKYERLGLQAIDYTPSDELLYSFADTLKKRMIDTQIMSI
jgi:pyruvate formate lyase activating enzyme